MANILGFLNSLWDMIVNALQSVLMAVNMLIHSVGFVGTFIAYIPAVISSAIIIYLAVFVIRFLLFK